MSGITANIECQREIGSYKERMPIARCPCSFEILVVPDLKAMNRAMKMHLAARHKKDYHQAEEKLAQQVLIVASKMYPEA